MIEDLTGKAVLITGSSTGIGAAAAVAFGRNGAKAAVHYNKSKAEAAKVLPARSRKRAAKRCWYRVT